MYKLCPKCGEEIEGQDLGDHPVYLTFWCQECDVYWGENCLEDFMDQAKYQIGKE